MGNEELSVVTEPSPESPL